MSQKKVFLESEADAWFSRNHNAVSARDFSKDDELAATIVELVQMSENNNRETLKILEIGCGEGKRLAWFAENLNAEVFGVEPSAKAVEVACSRGVNAKRGTADDLPFISDQFDIVIFGFCLYLCDRKDLFQIAKEADRVLKDNAWLVIQDFFATSPVRRDYHHLPGLQSYKMDYRVLFDWHPAYTCYSHKILHHAQNAYTDDSQEWVATSVMRKRCVDV